jgi:hypothetical protein
MSDLYFFKMLMKADTNIAFGEEFIVLDSRGAGAVFVDPDAETAEPVPTIEGAASLSLPATSGTAQRPYHTSNGAGVTAETDADWLEVSTNGGKVTFAYQAYAYDAEGDATRSATVTLGIEGTTATKSVTVTQAMAGE